MDLGTPEKYLQAHYDLLAGRVRGVDVRGAVDRRRPPTSSPARRSARAAAVGAEARVAAGAAVEDSVIHPGASVGAGAVVRGSIIGPGAHVGATARRSRGACSARARASPTDSSSPRTKVATDGEAAFLRKGSGVAPPRPHPPPGRLNGPSVGPDVLGGSGIRRGMEVERCAARARARLVVASLVALLRSCRPQQAARRRERPASRSTGPATATGSGCRSGAPTGSPRWAGATRRSSSTSIRERRSGSTRGAPGAIRVGLTSGPHDRPPAGAGRDRSDSGRARPERHARSATIPAGRRRGRVLAQQPRLGGPRRNGQLVGGHRWGGPGTRPDRHVRGHRRRGCSSPRPTRSGTRGSPTARGTIEMNLTSLRRRERLRRAD